MAYTESNFEWIEAYLAGELPAEEQKAFEAKLRDDATFAEEVALQRDTHRLVQVAAELDYKKELQRIDAEMERMRKQPFFRHLSVRIAAMLLVLVACGYALVFWQYNSQRIFQQAFDPYPDKFALRSEAPAADSLLISGMEAYNRKDYPTAIRQLEAVLADRPGLAGAQLYLGLSHLAAGQASAAIRSLRQAAQSPTWAETAQWSLALALLEDGQSAAARTALQEIQSQPTNAYAAQAGRLLSKLDAFWRKLPGM